MSTSSKRLYVYLQVPGSDNWDAQRVMAGMDDEENGVWQVFVVLG